MWAFAQGFGAASHVLKYNGHSWSVVRTFGNEIADATVLASNDVWVYGETGIPGFQPALGVWHYNGSSWRQVSTSIQGGSALSATSAWGFNGVDVEHWNGAKWTAMSVKSLLPAKNPEGLNNPGVAGVLALSNTNVYALGSGGTQDEGGPLVVLHYNGHKWTKLAAGPVRQRPERRVQLRRQRRALAADARRVRRHLLSGALFQRQADQGSAPGRRGQDHRHRASPASPAAPARSRAGSPTRPATWSRTSSACS